MTKFSLFKRINPALVCAALILTGNSTHAADIRVNAGTTWVLGPTADPSVLTHTVDGIVQVSLLGNCAFHADVLVGLPASPDQPYTLKGTFTFTSADGTTTLNADAVGTGTPDLANVSFLNFQYHVTFTGGSGQFVRARGEAEIDGAALFTSASAGKATWTLKGHVLGVNQGKKQTKIFGPNRSATSH